jgi:hypothetical protein
MSFVEWDAAVMCNLDLWKWENDLYPKWFKEKTIAFYNLKGLVDLHTNDAQARKAEQEAERAKQKR